MPSPIEINALQLVVELFKKDADDNVHFEGADLKEWTGLSPRDINDAVEYLDGHGLIDRLSFMGTSPYNFGGINLNTRGGQFN